MEQDGLEPRVERRLAAILATDVAGYSRLMGLDEEALQALKSHRKVLVDPTVAAHHGRVVKTTGDGDRKSTRLNSSHSSTSYAVFCLKKNKTNIFSLLFCRITNKTKARTAKTARH